MNPNDIIHEIEDKQAQLKKEGYSAKAEDELTVLQVALKMSQDIDENQMTIDEFLKAEHETN